MTSAPSSRASRRRILTIGPVDLGPDVRIETTVMDSIFQALGAIAICPAGRPIEAVLLAPTEGGIEDLAHSADAIRRLDATVLVVLVSDDAVSPALAARFDGHVRAPVDDRSLTRLLDGTSDVPAPASTTPPPAPAPTPTTAPPAEVAPAPQHDSRETADPPTAPLPTLPRSLEPLGDTDLVEAMLHGPYGVRPLLLQMVTQKTGWSDVRIEPEDATGRGAAIRFGGQEFGFLLAAPASCEAVRPWAHWMARWLALDDAQRELREMAFQDELTSAWNRRYLKEFLAESLVEARRIRRQLTVMVFDIDDFKTYNDRYGHSAGDTILRETVRLLGSTIRDGDRVCRIGGDEFAVIFADMQAPRTPGSTHPESVEAIARRFQEQICAMRFPELGLDAPGTLSISGGLASFPWDGQDGEALLHIADQRALESKRRGKNCLTIGPGARTRWPEHE
tara:strand:+ start:15639 stop:16988 length:1350 start_codon:yes stop_codon:yes gene_type:complete